jgi:hypothetical protein
MKIVLFFGAFFATACLAASPTDTLTPQIPETTEQELLILGNDGAFAKKTVNVLGSGAKSATMSLSQKTSTTVLPLSCNSWFDMTNPSFYDAQLWYVSTCGQKETRSKYGDGSIMWIATSDVQFVFDSDGNSLGNCIKVLAYWVIQNYQGTGAAVLAPTGSSKCLPLNEKG